MSLSVVKGGAGAVVPEYEVPETAAEFAGQVALVTGGGKGIGGAISRELARRGADVAINFRSDTRSAQETADEIEALGRRAVLVPADITDPAGAEAMVGAVCAALGPVDLLVNNAAYTRIVAPEDLTLRMWRRIFAANVEAAFHVAWLVKDGMRARGRGAIVNVSSTAARRPDSNMIAYGASKAALEAFTASAALAFAADGIRVNAVAPGYTRTPRVDTVDPAVRAGLLARVPLGRAGTAGEIAAVVAFLLSDAAAFVTGQVVTAAGGP